MNASLNAHAPPRAAHPFTVQHHASVTSTMDVAHAAASSGAPSGTVILADEQTVGRGRSGSHWLSAPGAGVWMTVLVRPDATSARTTDTATATATPAAPAPDVAPSVLSLRVGLALCDALEPFAPAPLWLKWPNDVLCGDARESAGKLAGILVEARWSGAQLAWLAIGIGINRVPPPADVALAYAAASLGVHVDARDVVDAVVPGVLAAAARSGPLAADELAAWRRHDAAAGRPCTAPEPGTVSGIAPDGSLEIVRADGSTARLHAGSLRFA